MSNITIADLENEMSLCEMAYKQGYKEALNDVMNLPKHYYKTYEHGFVEEERVISISDIAKLKEQNK